MRKSHIHGVITLAAFLLSVAAMVGTMVAEISWLVTGGALLWWVP